MDQEKKNGQFSRDMEDKDKNNTWRCMRKSNLKGCTKALTCKVQEQSMRTNSSSTILTKQASHPFVGCMVQEMRLYLIQ